MTYNRNDESRPPNYCGVDFGRDCCPECGGEVYRDRRLGAKLLLRLRCAKV